ncbi:MULTISPECIES: hypothetical protein [Paenibacillus]|uniref:Small acid-soluble spore protein L (Minor) n=2 Tax=Paenibacillus TaxID=44249 RepID=A0ABU3R7S5_9BACL|nr:MULTISPECIES: hypothetical protein [Paenibacillus]MDU0200324.1 hypothetical protein [Paenibacillus sp. PFR10]MEB4798287.1 hypothetical protein [Paenibacillus chondroitinus]MEC0265880.1 hypothetical protein [Paenibacillus anseongense]
MSGRNSKPKNNGPSGSPSRLDQFGDKAAQQDKREMKERNNKSSC